MRNRDTSVGILIRLRAGRPSNRLSIPGRGKDSSASCLMVTGGFPPWGKLLGHGVTAYLNSAPRVRTGGDIPPLPICHHCMVLN
jgi:hypothetical protein